LKIPHRHLAVAAGVLALAGGGSALATPGNGHGNGQGDPNGTTGASGPTGPRGPSHHGKAKGKHKTHKVAYIFHGTWNVADSSVTVTGGNAHVRKAGFIGQKVTFDFANAKIVVGDTDGDGSLTLADLKDGDHVLVGARLPRHNPGSPPFSARKLIDQTHPAP
jgi:hypothetical protein